MNDRVVVVGVVKMSGWDHLGVAMVGAREGRIGRGPSDQGGGDRLQDGINFFFSCSGAHRNLRCPPTRRSSDLPRNIKVSHRSAHVQARSDGDQPSTDDKTEPKLR